MTNKAGSARRMESDDVAKKFKLPTGWVSTPPSPAVYFYLAGRVKEGYELAGRIAAAEEKARKAAEAAEQESAKDDDDGGNR